MRKGTYEHWELRNKTVPYEVDEDFDPLIVKIMPSTMAAHIESMHPEVIDAIAEAVVRKLREVEK